MRSHSLLISVRRVIVPQFARWLIAFAICASLFSGCAPAQPSADREIAKAMRAEYFKLETFSAGKDLSKLLAARMMKHAN